MGALSALGALFGLIGTGVKGLFGFKEAQANVVSQALRTIGDVEASEGQREQALAQVLASEASSGYWLAACWRPITMLVFVGILVSFWFGFTPPNLNAPMSPMILRLFDLIEIGLGGYIGGRTLEKIVNQIGMASTLKAYINKKVW